MSLESLLRARPDLWRGSDVERAGGGELLCTGYAELDSALGGGWPRGALSEFLVPDQGLAALGLVLPAMARLSREERWIAWIDPPQLPYAPGLAAQGVELPRLLLLHTPGPEDGLWTLEQALGSGDCAAVLAWPRALPGQALRRLQLAAESGNALGWLFRPPAAVRERSPAALRVQVQARVDGGSEVQVLKRRGGWARGPVSLPAIA